MRLSTDDVDVPPKAARGADMRELDNVHVVIAKAKAAAIEHWGLRPCGADVARDAEEGSAEFFRLTDEDRYGRYAPWLPAIARFERFTGQDLLEIGCGTGADLARFAKAGARVNGVDLVPRHLRLTRQRFDLLGLHANLAIADAERLPYNEASFDAVYSFGVIHHTSDMRRAVDEIRRVLRPDGVALIAVYNLLSVNFALTLIALWQDKHLLREPFGRSLARIEGAEGERGPTVRVLTAWQFRFLLRGFDAVSIHTRHVAWTGRRRPPLRSWIEQNMGWYLWAECRR